MFHLNYLFCDFYLFILFYFILFLNYNTITNYIQITYEQSNLDHVLGVVSQTRVSGGNRTHDPHANSLAHYQLGYQGTLFCDVICEDIMEIYYFSRSYYSG